MRKKCLICETEFEAKINQKCCSDKCKIERKKQTDKAKIKGFKLTCQSCGDSFIGNKGTGYCSFECKSHGMKTNHKESVTKCSHCEKEFAAKKIGKINLCSKECRYEYQKLHWMKTHTKKCMHCGIEYETTNKNQQCCSRRCDASRRSQIARERSRDSFSNTRARVEYKRRQRKFNSLIEKVYLNTLIVRDKGCCQICGDLVDLTVHYNHRLAPTNDHIIPLALGGETSYQNCQLAHRYCNSKKSHFVEVV